MTGQTSRTFATLIEKSPPASRYRYSTRWLTGIGVGPAIPNEAERDGPEARAMAPDEPPGAGLALGLKVSDPATTATTRAVAMITVGASSRRRLQVGPVRARVPLNRGSASIAAAVLAHRSRGG